MKLLSLQIGRPETHGDSHATTAGQGEWTSSIWKTAVTHPLTATVAGLQGDVQADRRVHGGPDKAINAYPAQHLTAWAQELGLDLAPGAFGENFTLSAPTEDEVCIGDRFAVGTAVVQVSQPRQPCWKLGRRWAVPEFAALVQRTGRTGWYFRVLEPGTVQAGQVLELQDRPFPQWTITAANRIYYQRPRDPALARALADCAALATSWQTALRPSAT